MSPTEPPKVFDAFRLDVGNAQLWRGNEQISLRPKSFDVLHYLVDHAGELVTKARLLSIERARIDGAPLLFDDLPITVKPPPAR